MSSSIPAVLQGMLTLCADALPTGRVVTLGEPDGRFQRFVAVGWHAEQPGVTATQQASDMGHVKAYETFDVTSTLRSWYGNKAQSSTAVDDVYADLDLIAAALEADPSVGGEAMFAELSVHDMSLALSQNGPIATLTWIVHVQAQRS